MNSLLKIAIATTRKFESEILTEWEQLLFYFRNKQSQFEYETEEIIFTLKKILFSNGDLQEILFKRNVNLAEKLDNVTGQLVMSLLENSTLKAILTTEKLPYIKQQAINYLFNTFSDYLFGTLNPQHNKSANIFNELVLSKQLPIVTIVIIEQYESGYIVKDAFFKSKKYKNDIFHINEQFKERSLYSVIELILDRLESYTDEQYSVIPIPFNNQIILFCINEITPFNTISFINYILKILKYEKDSLQNFTIRKHWDESIIMFQQSIIKSQNFNELIKNIADGLVNYFPYERCAIFSYSATDELSFGLLGKHVNDLEIKEIKEQIDQLPLIKSSLKSIQRLGGKANFIQPMYIENAASTFPHKYVEQFELTSLIVVPLFTTSTNELLGAAIIDYGPNKQFKFCRESFNALKKCGLAAGELINNFKNRSQKRERVTAQHLFSPREIEVLSLMAKGASTNEAANILHLSKYTVRDYISTIMKKMNAKNRTEAVARAIKKGVI